MAKQQFAQQGGSNLAQEFGLSPLFSKAYALAKALPYSSIAVDFGETMFSCGAFFVGKVNQARLR